MTSAKLLFKYNYMYFMLQLNNPINDEFMYARFIFSEIHTTTILYTLFKYIDNMYALICLFITLTCFKIIYDLYSSSIGVKNKRIQILDLRFIYQIFIIFSYHSTPKVCFI